MGRPGLGGVFSGGFVAFANNLRETKASLAVGGEWSVPSGISNASLLLVGAATLIGFLLGYTKKPRAASMFLGAAVLGVTFLVSASTGVRSYLLVTMLLLIGTYVASRVCFIGREFKIPLRVYISGLVVIGAFLVWVVIVQSARRQDFTFARVGDTLGYLRAWFAGYIPALSVWSQSGLSGSPALGENMLRAVLEPLHLVSGQGFSEQISTVEIGGGATSNAMTILRPLLLDFGYVGSILFCVAAGLVCQRVFMLARSGRIGFVIPLAAAYVSCVFSFNYWFFAYGSRVIGIVLAACLVGVSSGSRRSHSSASDRSASVEASAVVNS